MATNQDFIIIWCNIGCNSGTAKGQKQLEITKKTSLFT